MIIHGHHFDWFDVAGIAGSGFLFIWPWVTRWMIVNWPRPTFPLWKRFLYDFAIDMPALRPAPGMVGITGSAEWNGPGVPSRRPDHNPPTPADLPPPVLPPPLPPPLPPVGDTK